MIMSRLKHEDMQFPGHKETHCSPSVPIPKNMRNEIIFLDICARPYQLQWWFPPSLHGLQNETIKYWLRGTVLLLKLTCLQSTHRAPGTEFSTYPSDLTTCPNLVNRYPMGSSLVQSMLGLAWLIFSGNKSSLLLLSHLLAQAADIKVASRAMHLILSF